MTCKENCSCELHARPTPAAPLEPLKGCPFCGSAPLLEEHPPHEHHLELDGVKMPDHPGSFTIECPGCSVGMIADTRAEVETAWNRRVPECLRRLSPEEMAAHKPIGDEAISAALELGRLHRWAAMGDKWALDELNRRAGNEASRGEREAGRREAAEAIACCLRYAGDAIGTQAAALGPAGVIAERMGRHLNDAAVIVDRGDWRRFLPSPDSPGRAP